MLPLNNQTSLKELLGPIISDFPKNQTREIDSNHVVNGSFKP